MLKRLTLTYKVCVDAAACLPVNQSPHLGVAERDAVLGLASQGCSGCDCRNQAGQPYWAFYQTAVEKPGTHRSGRIHR